MIVLHGGPGGGSRPEQRNFFDPLKYRVLLHDQRGCGLSGADSPLSENTTEAILQDLRFIQSQLGIEGWVLFGGSWGATLALLFAQRWPENTLGMVLRGAFLARKRDLDWFVGDEGAPRFFPEAWEKFCHDIGRLSGQSILPIVDQGLSGPDQDLRQKVALAWEQWGAVLALGQALRKPIEQNGPGIARIIRQVTLEIHYATHHYFIEEDQILGAMNSIGHIPAAIIHGRLDWVCPVESSLEIHRRLGRSFLRILEGSHHVPVDEPMISALLDATSYLYQELRA